MSSPVGRTQVPGQPDAAPAASPGVLRGGAAVEDDGAKAEESDPAAAPERLFGFFLGVQKETRPQAKLPPSRPCGERLTLSLFTLNFQFLTEKGGVPWLK